MMPGELPCAAKSWKDYAVQVETTDGRLGFCVHVYNRDRAGERWAHSQLGAVTLEELGTQLAVALHEAHRRGFEESREQMRAAIGIRADINGATKISK